MQQREEDSLISSDSLGIHEEKEHYDNVIDDDLISP
jgi:hypothetical protein